MQVGQGDVGRVVAVAAVRLGEAVHVEQLPVGHLPVRVEHLLPPADGPDADHLQTLLRNTQDERRRERVKNYRIRDRKV